MEEFTSKFGSKDIYIKKEVEKNAKLYLNHCKITEHFTLCPFVLLDGVGGSSIV